MDYLNLEKKKLMNKHMLINTSKIILIYILNSGNKVDIDYKDNRRNCIVQVLNCTRVSEAARFLLFYTALSLIFLDFLHELLQNYLFLEIFQILTHCHCKPSYVHVRVSDLYDYRMFYHSTSVLRNNMQTEIQ